MSNGTPGAIATGLSNIFTSLTPRQLWVLGNHLTQSDEMRALQILTTMEANPALAPAMLPSLSTIPNLPPEVMTWVTTALSTPAAFQQNMAQAVAALQRNAVSVGILGNLGL